MMVLTRNSDIVILWLGFFSRSRSRRFARVGSKFSGMNTLELEKVNRRRFARLFGNPYCSFLIASYSSMTPE